MTIAGYQGLRADQRVICTSLKSGPNLTLTVLPSFYVVYVEPPLPRLGVCQMDDIVDP
jgi:hypothetical protein